MCFCVRQLQSPRQIQSPRQDGQRVGSLPANHDLRKNTRNHIWYSRTVQENTSRKAGRHAQVLILKKNTKQSRWGWISTTLSVSHSCVMFLGVLEWESFWTCCVGHAILRHSENAARVQLKFNSTLSLSLFSTQSRKSRVEILYIYFKCAIILTCTVCRELSLYSQDMQAGPSMSLPLMTL